MHHVSPGLIGNLGIFVLYRIYHHSKNFPTHPGTYPQPRQQKRRNSFHLVVLQGMPAAFLLQGYVGILLRIITDLFLFGTGILN